MAQSGELAQAHAYHQASLALARAGGSAPWALAGQMHALNTLGLDATKLGADADARAAYSRAWPWPARAVTANGGPHAEYLGYMLRLAGQARKPRRCWPKA